MNTHVNSVCTVLIKLLSHVKVHIQWSICQFSQIHFNEQMVLQLDLDMTNHLYNYQKEWITNLYEEGKKMSYKL